MDASLDWDGPALFAQQNRRFSAHWARPAPHPDVCLFREPTDTPPGVLS